MANKLTPKKPLGSSVVSQKHDSALPCTQHGNVTQQIFLDYSGDDEGEII